MTPDLRPTNYELMSKTFTVYLDRDGTICEEKNYISKPEQVVLLKGAVDGLKKLSQAGGVLVIVTNQSGIGRGYYTEADMEKVNERLFELLSSEGIELDGLYYCPHHVDGNVAEYTRPCDCRKPGAGMVEQAREELELPMGKEFVVGDKDTDIMMGKSISAGTILVSSGYGEESLKKLREDGNEPDMIVNDLIEAADWIEGQL